VFSKTFLSFCIFETDIGEEDARKLVELAVEAVDIIYI
jgi:hypothetical protein